MTTPRTVVEFVDPTGKDNCALRPQKVLINGQEVLVEMSSVKLDSGFQEFELTRVTLTIIPDEVRITRSPRIISDTPLLA